jgi:ribulose bisphosphate carboxylase small subunit
MSTTKIELDAALAIRLRNPIWQVWNTIGADLEDGGEMDNLQAVECCVDADHLALHGRDPEAQALITEVFSQYPVSEVLNFLSKNFRLA